MLVKKCCPCAPKNVGMLLVSFSIGGMAGLLCPPHVLAAVELLALALLGYLCLFKW